MSATSNILSVPVGDLGALFVGVGAVLLLLDAVSSGPGITAMTFGGTLPTPERRLSAGAELVGSLLVAIGSGLLLAASHGLTLLAIIIVIVTSAALIYVAMTARLRAHIKLVARERDDAALRSWLWCFTHPLWRPSRDIQDHQAGSASTSRDSGYRALKDLEYRAEFERQQFALYDARRLSAETHASAIIAAALAVGTLVATDYSRDPHPGVAWLIAALAGLLGAGVLANLARVVAWTTPQVVGGPEIKPPDRRPSDDVRRTLLTFRELDVEDPVVLRERAIEHWQARAISAYGLGTAKDRRLRLSLLGFLGPVAYLIASLVS